MEYFTLPSKVCCGVMLNSRISLKFVVLVEYAKVKGSSSFTEN